MRKRTWIIGGVALLAVAVVALLPRSPSDTAAPASGGPRASGTGEADDQVVAAPTALPHAPRAMPASGGLLRLVTPVRLSPTQGPALDAELAATSELLERFQAGGYDYALWEVDPATLPADPDAAGRWAAQCRSAFPGRCVLRILSSDAALSASARALLAALRPDRDAVLIHAAVPELLQQVHAAVPALPLWLALAPSTPLNLEPATLNLLSAFYLLHDHNVGIARPAAAAPSGSSPSAPSSLLPPALRATGKPVILGPLAYVSPRERPGIEQDLREQYLDRLGMYEEWLVAQGFAGFSRELGTAIPAGVSPNLEYVASR